jgi:hypothetical protein
VDNNTHLSTHTHTRTHTHTAVEGNSLTDRKNNGCLISANGHMKGGFEGSFAGLERSSLTDRKNKESMNNLRKIDIA